MRFTLARMLWLFAAVLAATVAVEAMPGRKLQPIALPPAAETPQAAASVLEPIEAWVSTALARPLFAVDRRPPAVAAAPAAGAAGPQNLPRLAGIVVSSTSRAAIFAGEAGHSTVVAEGAEVGPWKVMAIHADAVDVTGPGGARTVKPAYSNEAPAAAPSPVTALAGPAAALAAFQAFQQPHTPGNR